MMKVALKVIKHCQEEGSSSELVTGILVGLVVGKTLEITNCFPLPKDDDHEDDSMLIPRRASAMLHRLPLPSVVLVQLWLEWQNARGL